MELTMLMIDDDYELTANVKSIISQSDITLLHAFEYQAGSRLIARKKLSAIVLNPLLPGIISGFTFLEDLRATLPLPILATGYATAEERIKAYHLGADLFIQKPIDSLELVAAIHALHRRYYSLNRVAEYQDGGLSLRCKDLMLNDRRRSVLQRGQPVILSPKEFGILYFLASNPGIVFSQETIYERIWKAEFPFGSRCVADHVSAIRQKLGQRPGDESYIETVYGVGYRFTSSI